MNEVLLKMKRSSLLILSKPVFVFVPPEFIDFVVSGKKRKGLGRIQTLSHTKIKRQESGFIIKGSSENDYISAAREIEGKVVSKQ